MNNGQTPIHRVKRVSLRDAFPHEAHHFTAWMGKNIEALADEIGIQLTVNAREHVIGPYRIDLLCQDADGRTVIIENQLEPTNLGHLGQVIMYLVNMDAKTAVWVASDTTPEFIKVVAWLNEATPADISFFLVRAEAISIDGSGYAPLFTVVVRPSSVTKAIGAEKSELAERHLRRREFWKELLEKSNSVSRLFANISPSKDNYITATAGTNGVGFSYYVYMDAGMVTLYIDCDRGSGEKNKAVFDSLHAQKEAIERELGAALDWRRQEGVRHSRIDLRTTEGGLAHPESWPHLQEQMVDMMIRFEQAFRPRLEESEVLLSCR